MVGYIYKTTNLINGKIYIGKKESEKFDKNYLGSGKLIKRAINKYTLRNFDTIVLEWCKTKEELNQKERFWIKYYTSQDFSIGYNIASGGDGGDIISKLPKDDYKTFIKECSKRNAGKNNPNYNNGDKIKGDKNPARRAEVRAKISRAVSGKNNGMYGKKQTKEAMFKKENTTRERYGYIPNQFTKDKSKWVYFVLQDGNRQLFRSKTECARELKKYGFSEKVIKHSYDKVVKEKQKVKIANENILKCRSKKHESAIKQWPDSYMVNFEITPR